MARKAESGYNTIGYSTRNATFYDNGNVVDIRDVSCAHMYIYNRNNGRKTAYLHYIDGVEVWELTPALWRGWKKMYTLVAGNDIY